MIRNTASERQLAARLCAGDIDPLVSSLHNACGGGVEKLLLDMICCGRLSRLDQIAVFMSCTLMHCQQEEAMVDQRSQEAVQFLLTHQFIAQAEGGVKLVPTQKGCACSVSGMSPFDVDEVLAALEHARRRFILKGGFHAVFLATPVSARTPVQWGKYETILAKLLMDQPDLLDVLEYLGWLREEVAQFILKPPKHDSKDPRVSFYRRLYHAIILFNVVQEKPITRVAETISSSRGDIQTLQKEASSHCGMTAVFARKLNWTHIAAILESYSQRLNFGVRDDLLPLVRLGASMPAFRARFFFGSGLKTPQDIVHAPVELITTILMDCVFEGRDTLDVIKTGTKLQVGHAQSEAECARRASEKEQYERLARTIVQCARELLSKQLDLLLK